MSTNQFGKLLTQGLKCIAALEKIDLTDLQHELGREIGVSVWTLYKWRKGSFIPNDDRTIALLGRVCVERGRMDRQWLTSFLAQTIYSDKQTLTNDLCPEDAAPLNVIQNLPRRQHTRLIGREQELEDIRNFLSPRHRVGVVCISGGGGVGKTALALEVAHGCYEESTRQNSVEQFEAIIWVTAKNVELLPAGQVARQPTFTDLDGIYRAVAELLDLPVIFRSATQAEKNLVVTHLLAKQRVLLMLDNLEDVDDQELMVFLRDLPAPSKAVVTTRQRIDVAVPVHLNTLDEATAVELAQMECEQHHLMLSDAQIRTLLLRTGGLPLAIIRTIGRMAWRGSNVETEINHLQDARNEIYDFCFGKTIALIQPGDAYQLFITMALFAAEVSRDALGFVAELSDPMRRDEALSDLEVLSLCTKNRDRFGLEPLPRAQATNELRTQADFEAQARERWVEWYLRFTERYGGRDGQEMHLNYDHLEEDWNNILAVMHWCTEQGRYENMVTLWNHVRDFTHIYGYWADRLRLLDWLITAAESRGDYATAIYTLYDKAFTLTLTSPATRLEEADALLQRCWSLRDHVDLILQAKVAALRASLSIKQREYAQALDWLEQAENLLSQTQIEPLELARERTSLLFDKGEAWLVMGELAKAQTVFEEMLEQATISGWQRSAIHAKNWLAYTAILQNNCTLGDHYLQLGWPVANRIKEKRVHAYYKRTFAYYYDRMGELGEALKWANEAHDAFERLGMPPDLREMEGLIERLRLGKEVKSKES
ncbi:MAG: AAA family ATPase [Chloroflexi bacterium]|nr:AAA family ATPase [Chloroflexota bacterium]